MKLTPTQKILLGRILIGFMSVILLLFFVTFLVTLFSSSSVTGNQATAAIGNVFVLGLFYFPLLYGIKLHKQGKDERTLQTLPMVEGNYRIRGTSTITLQAYKALVYQLLYQHAIIQYMTFLGVCMLLLQVTQKKFEWASFPTLIVVMAFLIPIATYIQAQKSYDSSAYLKETVVYEFNPDQVMAQGTTFYNTISWASLHRVKELKQWFLLYNSSQTLFAIPKNAFQSEEELTHFRNLILSTQVPRKEILLPSPPAVG